MRAHRPVVLSFLPFFGLCPPLVFFFFSMILSSFDLSFSPAPCAVLPVLVLVPLLTCTKHTTLLSPPLPLPLYLLASPGAPGFYHARPKSGHALWLGPGPSLPSPLCSSSSSSSPRRRCRPRRGSRGPPLSAPLNPPESRCSRLRTRTRTPPTPLPDLQ